MVLHYIFEDLKDNANVSDSQLIELLKSLSENVNVSDIQLLDFIKNISDNTNILDKQLLEFVKSLSDSANVSDKQLLDFIKNISDNTNILDKQIVDSIKNISENANISDVQLIELLKSLSDGANVSETKLLDFIKNIPDVTNISDTQIKDVSKVISEFGENKWINSKDYNWNTSKDNKWSWTEIFKAFLGSQIINISEYISNIVNKLVPEQKNKTWSYNKLYSWSISKDKEWSWTEIFKTLVGSEATNIIEYLSAIIIKHINASDNIDLCDIINKDIDKSNLETLIVQEILNFVVESFYSDTANVIEIAKKEINKYLPEESVSFWNKYVQTLWSNLGKKTVFEVLNNTDNSEYLVLTESLKTELEKNINNNINFNELLFLDIFKLIEESANIEEFIAQFVAKYLEDSASASDEINKDINKNIFDISNVEEETYYKLYFKPVKVKMDILDINFNKIAILTNAWDVCITEVVNGEYSLTFKMPLNEPIAKYIDDKHYIRVRDQLFFFTNFTTERTQNNQTFMSVEAQHIFFELENKYWSEDDESKNYHSNVEMYTLVDKLLKNTNFVFSYSTGVPPTDILLRRGSIMNNLKIIVDAFGLELRRDNREFSLERRIGTDSGIQFRYSKNIKTIKKSVDMRNIINRLYVYGKDGLTINGVNGGKAYLDSQYISSYTDSKITVSEVVFNNITNPKLLLEKGIEYLKIHEIPKISYDVNIVELKKLSGMIYNESFGIGDNVTIIDSELDTDVMARVIEYRYYPFEPKESSVVLGNFIPRATDFFSKWNNTSGIVDNAFFKDSGKVNTKWLEGIIDTMQNKLLASESYRKAQVIEDKGFLLENLGTADADSERGALYLGAGIFSIADSKNPDGKWNWRTFGTGAGFTADVINTGALNAEVIKASELEVGKNVTMGDNAVINWNNETNKANITKITKDTVSTEYVNALNITAKNAISADKVNANWVYAGNLTANQITTGAFNASLITTGSLNANLITTGAINSEVIKASNLEVGKNVTMGANAVINWSNETNKSNITKITKDTIKTTEISADKITSGTLDVTNVKIVSSYGNNHLELSSKGLVGFNGKVVHGVLVDNENLNYMLVSYGNVVGKFYFDHNGAGNASEARERVIVETSGLVPLKFRSGSGISFESNDKVYFATPVEFNNKVNFAGATVEGLNLTARFG